MSRDFPREPYPNASVFGVLALIGAMLLLLVAFGINAIGGLSGVTGPVQLLYASLTGLAIATPIVGIRALFGDHPIALVALIGAGAVFLGAVLVGEPLGAAPLTEMLATAPAVVVLSVAAFALWKRRQSLTPR